MKAMILAAGRGERMRPLTDSLPKPLLTIAGKSLIEYHIEKLVNAGITELIINHAWLGDKIEAQLGDGSRYGADIYYSPEVKALETAGGIKNALHFFADEPFLVINADVFTDYPVEHLISVCQRLAMTSELDTMAHLVLVNNPEHHLQGDFYCWQNQLYEQMDVMTQAQRYTFSGIACYRPQFFQTMTTGKQALAPLLRAAMAKGQVRGEIYLGEWWDIGTPERLQQLNQTYKKHLP